MTCPLCGSVGLIEWVSDQTRSFYKCHHCSLVSVPSSSILSPKLERERYDQHNNSEHDPRYYAYLDQIAKSIRPYIEQCSTGLDFGCGSSTLLGRLMEGEGRSVCSYDLYYHPDESIWNKKFDFIVLCEVIEHLNDLGPIMKRLGQLLTDEGHLFVKTKLMPPTAAAFVHWFYKQDPTHIRFFDHASMSYLGKELEMKGPESIGHDLVKFKK